MFPTTHQPTAQHSACPAVGFVWAPEMQPTNPFWPLREDCKNACSDKRRSWGVQKLSEDSSTIKTPFFFISFTCLSWFTLQGRRTLAAGTPTCKANMKQNTPINREITDSPPAPVAKSSPSKGLPLLYVVCSPKWSWPCYQTALTLHRHVVIPLEIHWLLLVALIHRRAPDKDTHGHSGQWILTSEQNCSLSCLCSLPWAYLQHKASEPQRYTKLRSRFEHCIKIPSSCYKGKNEWFQEATPRQTSQCGSEDKRQLPEVNISIIYGCGVLAHLNFNSHLKCRLSVYRQLSHRARNGAHNCYQKKNCNYKAALIFHCDTPRTGTDYKPNNKLHLELGTLFTSVCSRLQPWSSSCCYHTSSVCMGEISKTHKMQSLCVGKDLMSGRRQHQQLLGHRRQCSCCLAEPYLPTGGQ